MAGSGHRQRRPLQLIYESDVRSSEVVYAGKHERCSKRTICCVLSRMPFAEGAPSHLKRMGRGSDDVLRILQVASLH